MLDARIARSRIALMNAGLKLFIKNPNVTMSEIALYAGIGRATLHRQFQTREHLIQAIALWCLKTLDKATAHISLKQYTAKQAIEAMILAITPFSDQFLFLSSIWDIAGENKEIMQIHNQQLQELTELIEYAKREGCIKKTIETKWIIYTLESLFYTSSLMMHQHHMSAETAAKLMIETLFYGITTENN